MSCIERVIILIRWSVLEAIHQRVYEQLVNRIQSYYQTEQRTPWQAKEIRFDNVKQKESTTYQNRKLNGDCESCCPYGLESVWWNRSLITRLNQTTGGSRRIKRVANGSERDVKSRCKDQTLPQMTRVNLMMRIRPPRSGSRPGDHDLRAEGSSPLSSPPERIRST